MYCRNIENYVHQKRVLDSKCFVSHRLRAPINDDWEEKTHFDCQFHDIVLVNIKSVRKGKRKDGAAAESVQTRDAFRV